MKVPKGKRDLGGRRVRAGRSSPPPLTSSVERGCAFIKGASRLLGKFRTKDISMTIKEKMTPGPWEALKMRFWWPS